MLPLTIGRSKKKTDAILQSTEFLSDADPV